MWHQERTKGAKQHAKKKQKDKNKSFCARELRGIKALPTFLSCLEMPMEVSDKESQLS